MTDGRPLTGLRVVEAASFVAVPFAGMSLAQLGADVVRVDPPGGASDFRRWPLAPSGESLFWNGLNKGKRSVVVDYRTDAGRDLLVDLVVAPGPGGGVLLDNLVGKRRPTYADLAARRPDAVHVHVQGKADGTPAVDYTVNAEVGVPWMTGPQDSAAPVNHVLPAWDLLTGMTAATTALAAVVHRAATGLGTAVDLPLADVALAGVGALGWLAEADARGRGRERHGNHMFGSFGVDFETSDGRRVMVVALTEGQWRALRGVTETEAVFAALEVALGADLDLESDRYRLRETIAAVLRPWFAQRDFAAVTALLDKARVLWSPYDDLASVAARLRDEVGGTGTVAGLVDQPGVGEMLATGAPFRWDGARIGPAVAPVLGAHTVEVLSEVLGLTSAEIGRLAAGRTVVV